MLIHFKDAIQQQKKVIIQSDNASGFFSQELIPFNLNKNTMLEYKYILHLGKTDLITDEGRTTYFRQTIYEPTSVYQSADGRRLLDLLTILKDNLVNLSETIVLHFPSDTDRVYFVKLNIIF